MLTDKQRTDLHGAIVGYLGTQGVSPELVEALAKEINAGPPQSDPSLLERKWSAIVRLQRRLLDLEAKLRQATVRQQHPLKHKEDWLPDATETHILEGHRGPVTCVALHPTFSVVVSGCEDGILKVWDTETGELELSLRAHTRAVTDVAFASHSRSNAILASCSSDMTIRLHDPQNKYSSLKTLLGHEHTVSGVRFVGPADETLVSASRDKTVRVWQVSTGFCTNVLRGHSDWVRALDCSSDGMFLITGSSDKTAHIVGLQNTLTSTPIVCQGHTHVIECLAVAPKESENYLCTLEGLQYPLETAASKSLGYFATGSRDKTIIIWNSKGVPIVTLAQHENWVRGLAFHPCGRYLFSVADDKTLRVWDLSNKAKCIRVITAGQHFVTGVCANTKLCATGSVDSSVRIW